MNHQLLLSAIGKFLIDYQYLLKKKRITDLKFDISRIQPKRLTHNECHSLGEPTILSVDHSCRFYLCVIQNIWK